jgi:serine/threonine protein kinase
MPTQNHCSAQPTSIADKPTIPPDRVPWISRMRSARTVADPKATVSYVVARDDRERPTIWGAPELSPRIRDDFAAGTVLQDRYRLISELGRGGMGVVYLGRDERLDRSVAVKVILSQGSAACASATMDSQVKSSFAEEARLGASLTHPAIATVFDFGFQHDSPFTVFEYIEGETLRELIERRGRLPLDEVRLLIGPLAQALDFAHERRIVHRDLKPENIRATEQRLFKILDLGLAREFSRQSDWRFAGTPAYAAPEQTAERPSDGRTDQYALAVILFELLTGRRPFVSDSWLDLLEMHFAATPPRLRSLDAEIPETVDDAIVKALEKDPNKRFSTCTELAVALGCQFLTGPAPLPRSLLETDIKKMGGRWKTVFYPFALARPRTHLTLAPDALWAVHRTDLMCWPLSAIFDLRRLGFRGLSFRIRGVIGKDRQWFRFNSRRERGKWEELLKSLLPGAEAGRAGERPAETATDPRAEPVVLLRGRPSTRFQLLGAVEVKGASRRSAESGLAVRGAMMGADAVVDWNDERLPGFTRTEHRASGIAVRTVDDEGRFELKSRWFSSQIDHLKLPLLLLAFLGLLFLIFPLLSLAVSLSTVGPSSAAIAELAWNRTPSLAFAIVMTALAIAVVVGRWPQLVRPTAVCFMATACQYGLLFLTRVESLVSLGLAYFGVRPGLADMGIANAEWITGVVGAGTVFVMLWQISVLFAYSYLGRRLWLISQEYRRLAGAAMRSLPLPAARRAIAALAWGAAVICSIGLVGKEASAVYRGAVSNLSGNETSRLNFERNRANMAKEVNLYAWRQITNPDPEKRSPPVALASWEPTLKREADNPAFLKTLGVIRYRNEDYPGSITELERCITLGGFDASAAFFLAAARARLGELEKAQALYDQADKWLGENEPNDAELKRFQQEAAAALYLAARRASNPTMKKRDSSPN